MPTADAWMFTLMGICVLAAMLFFLLSFED